MSTLVTGASGFVGRHLLGRLSDAIPVNREVADLSRPLPPLPRAERLVHCAAELDDVSRMQAVNVDGTARLLEWAQRTGVRELVYLSTGGTAAAGPYARTKREAEDLVLQSGLNVRVLRLFFVYGPEQSTRRLVPRLIDAVSAGRPVTIDPRGGPFLSLTYVTDAVDAILRDAGRTVIDVGDEAVAMRDLALCIGRAVGREPRFEVREENALDFIAIPGEFTPSTSLDAGIRATVACARIQSE